MVYGMRIPLNITNRLRGQRYSNMANINIRKASC